MTILRNLYKSYFEVYHMYHLNNEKGFSRQIKPVISEKLAYNSPTKRQAASLFSYFQKIRLV